jgi:SNF-related kinase
MNNNTIKENSMAAKNSSSSATTTTTTTTTMTKQKFDNLNVSSLIGEQHQSIAGLYELEETIGQGHFAVVKLGRHKFTGEKVAVKCIDKTKLDAVSRDHLYQEVRCMKLVQHPNVVRLYDVCDTKSKLYLILELGDGGDMYDYIMRESERGAMSSGRGGRGGGGGGGGGGLSERRARRYFRQIVRALKYCHDLCVVHRDLKPENVVFFSQTGQVKLTDFGFSNVFEPGGKLLTSCGSLAYSAPVSYIIISSFFFYISS